MRIIAPNKSAVRFEPSSRDLSQCIEALFGVWELVICMVEAVKAHEQSVQGAGLEKDRVYMCWKLKHKAFDSCVNLFFVLS